MKKLKILPSILMLVLCVGVLAVGVFAITPTKNQIMGSITINAINAGMEITPYKLTLDKDGNETAREALVQEPIISRTGIDIPLGNLSFNTETANTASDVADIVIAFSVNNTSSEALGMYFSTVASPTPTATTESIKLSAVTSGETPTTIPEMVEASFSGYNYLPIGRTEEIKLTFSLLKTHTEQASITLDTSNISLNITNLDTNLLVDGWVNTANTEGYGVSEWSQVKNLVIAEGTTSFSFRGYEENLENIILPESLTSLTFENDISMFHRKLKFNIDTNNPELKFLGSANNPYLCFVRGDLINREIIELPEGLKLFSNQYDDGFVGDGVKNVIIPNTIKEVKRISVSLAEEFSVTLKAGTYPSLNIAGFSEAPPSPSYQMGLFTQDVATPSTSSPYYIEGGIISGTLEVDTTYYIKLIELS